MIFSLLSIESSMPNGEDLSFFDISFLTFEAVLEVVIICFGGFVVAKTGLLNSKGQKVLSQLNVDLFTPCLVFTKLAPSLSFQKMADIIIIPIFYALTTGIAFGCSKMVSSFMGLNDPESDYVTAMAVFGNSNSLPVSLTLSLSYTLPDLLWDDIDDDSPDKVASRGILYLLIFQQLGQILRWSWGYNKLLRKRSYEEINDYGKNDSEIPRDPEANEHSDLALSAEELIRNSLNRDTNLQRDSKGPASVLIRNTSYRDETDVDSVSDTSVPYKDTPNGPLYYSDIAASQATHSGATTIINTHATTTDNSSSSSINEDPYKPFIVPSTSVSRNWVIKLWNKFTSLALIRGITRFMNPPLYAMVLSVLVASVPALQRLFFSDEPTSFVHNTVTKAITQLGSVSIPLILLVLGSNLCPASDMPKPSKHYKRIVVGSLLSRMILPSFFLLPIIALCVKFIKISILDDPIFLIVSFVLTISPPAIQLSQITQINNIYQKEMAGVLFWGYVVLTLPTTIFIVVTSLEVLKWATA